MSTSVRVVPDASVEAVRAFNRFYTRELGLLGDQHLGSALSLTETRVLFELAHERQVSPKDLAHVLALDRGYVTRLVQTLEKKGLVSRASSRNDARRVILTLTPAGRKTIARLERATRNRVARVLDTLDTGRQLRLIDAMRSIERLLMHQEPCPRPVVIREPHPGDIGQVIHRQAVLYAREYGWDWTYEGLVAKICGAFVGEFDPANEHCWIADRDGEVVGSVFLVRKSARVAQLRLLYVDPSARGMGLGRTLVDLCIAFARERGYRTMALWTNDVLVAARRIYEAVGFTLSAEERHRSFGKELVGQNWRLVL